MLAYAGHTRPASDGGSHRRSNIIRTRPGSMGGEAITESLLPNGGAVKEKCESHMGRTMTANTTLVVATLGLIAILLSAGAARVGELPADFFSMKLTDAAQAIGSLGTLVVAWLAYGSWRAQEYARRRADLAEKVLRAANFVGTSIHEARYLHDMSSTKPFENEADMSYVVRLSALSEHQRKALDASATAEAELHANRVIVAKLISVEAAEEMKQIAACRNLVLMANDDITRRRDTKNYTTTDSDKPFFVNGLMFAGTHLTPEQITMEDRVPTDRFARTLNDRIANLERLLEPSLSFR